MAEHMRVVSDVDEDIITKLSDVLTNNVLERLPIEDAVKTSILSRKWRYKWTTMRKLAIRRGFSNKFLYNEGYQHNGFIRIVNQIMILHKGPISKFHLYIPTIFLDSFQEIDQWMLIISRSSFSVTELELIITGYNNSLSSYQIPSHIFSCLELRKLALHRCIFQPPLEFQGFPNLEDLSLTGVYFKVVYSKGIHLLYSSCGNMINLPQLKKLTLINCVNVKNFNIKAVKLQRLWVIGCDDAMLLRLLHSKHLDVVRICIKRSIENLLCVERFNLMMMLTILPDIVSFTVDGYFLKFLAVTEFPKWLPHAMRCLKQMEFKSFSFDDLDQLQGALCILRNSPNLEGLRMTHTHMEPEADLELTSNYLESRDCLDQTLLMLQTVELTYLEGSRPELLFIKLLLDRSPNLENMVIQPRATDDAQKIVTIAKDVMLFPRASTKAKMVFLDPVPMSHYDIIGDEWSDLLYP